RYPAALRVGPARHPVEGDEPLPLMLRLPAGPVAALRHIAHRDASGGLVADVAVRVGEDDTEGRDVPRPKRLAELRRRARPVHRQQRRQPAAPGSTQPAQRYRPRRARRWRQHLIDNGAIARRTNRLAHRRPALDGDDLLASRPRLPLAVEEEAT